MTNLLKLGDIIIHKKGNAFKSTDFREVGVPVVRVTDFTQDGIDSKNVVYVDNETAEENEDVKLFTNDILIQTVGSWPNNPASVVGKVVRVPKELNNSLLNQNAVIIRPKPEFDRLYIFYLLKSQLFSKFIINHAQGAANQASITLDSIYRFEFKKIDIISQKKIAAILSAYDDLIENNKQRIKLLENMAEELYKEWFVRFRFPNWQNTEFEKGVPKGWKGKKIQDLVIRKNFGKIYKETELYGEGKIPVIDQSQKDFLGFYDGEPEHNASFDSPMIIFGDHSCKIHMMYRPFSLAENVIPFFSKQDVSTIYLYFLIKNQVETTEYKRHWGELTNKMVLVAPLLLQQSFCKYVLENFVMVENLKAINRKLSVMRDKLLPRLISGKLSVQQLNIHYPPSMQ